MEERDMRSHLSRRVPLSLLALACSALLFAACGSSNKDSGGVTKAASTVTKQNASLVAAPPTSPITQFPTASKLGGPPPKKSIAWLACELPTCQQMLSEGYKTAAAALGWNF